MRVLDNDPSGNESQFGPFIATVIMIFTWMKAIVLGIILLALGIAILIFAMMVIQFLFWIPTLFTSDIPFLAR